MLHFDSNATFYLLFYVLYAVLVLISLRKGENKNFLSMDQTNIMKGIFIVLIVVHHFTIRLSDPGLLKPFGLVGYLGVAGFFLFSGYGMMSSNLRKENYLKNYLISKLFRVYFPIVLAFFIIGVIGNLLNYHENNFVDLIKKTFLLINPINGSLNWFVTATLIFYLNFYVSFKLFSTKKAIISSFVLNGCYVVVGLYLGLGLWWINTAFAYPLGILLAYKKDFVISALKKYYWFLLLLAGALFSISFVAQEVINMNRTIQLLLMTISVVAFSMLILTAMYKINFKTKTFAFLGMISYELFLIHSSFFELVFDGFKIENSLFMIPVLMLIIAIAYVLYNADSFVFRMIKKKQGNKQTNTFKKAS